MSEPTERDYLEGLRREDEERFYLRGRERPDPTLRNLARSADGSVIHRADCQHARIPWPPADD